MRYILLVVCIKILTFLIRNRALFSLHRETVEAMVMKVSPYKSVGRELPDQMSHDGRVWVHLSFMKGNSLYLAVSDRGYARTDLKPGQKVNIRLRKHDLSKARIIGVTGC